MSARRLPRPTDAELEILHVLWRRGPSTVREVYEALDKPTAYTTILKLMQIMAAKGLVERDQSARAHVYVPRVTQQDAERQFITHLLDKVFHGSAMRLVQQALAARRASPREMEEIRRIFERSRRRRET
jgi:predicted transcriptional regulator